MLVLKIYIYIYIYVIYTCIRLDILILLSTQWLLLHTAFLCPQPYFAPWPLIDLHSMTWGYLDILSRGSAQSAYIYVTFAFRLKILCQVRSRVRTWSPRCAGEYTFDQLNIDEAAVGSLGVVCRPLMTLNWRKQRSASSRIQHHFLHWWHDMTCMYTVYIYSMRFPNLR